MVVETLKWQGGVDGFLELIDQRKLPCELVRLQCQDVDAVFNAIRTLVVRGAPAIGAAAAYGVVLGLRKCSDDSSQIISILERSCEYLSSARPTAANLFWALERVRRSGERFIADNPDASIESVKEVVLKEADEICREDAEMCRRIGQHGEKFIEDGMGVLTHCNAGALATVGQGTALSVIYEAHKKGKKFKVYVDETRPVLQGARLTAWELKQVGIETVVICDNMAGWLMKQGRINVIIVGADRVAANGDVANKIGTYSLSILAGRHGIPFYVAAPSSTFDLNVKSGQQIPIEQRDENEVTTFAGVRIVPEGVEICNPAFDVTEAKDICAIITEKGVIEKPNADKILIVLRS